MTDTHHVPPAGIARRDFMIAGGGAAALAAFAQWEEWLNLLLGLWVLVSPWVLGFQGTTAATVHILVGILVAALAAIEMWLMQQTPQAPR